MISPISLDNIFNVYSDHSETEEPKYRLIGKFLDTDSGIEILADYHGLLRGLAGPPSEKQNRKWRSITGSPYLHVVSLASIRNGEHPELLDEMNVPEVSGQKEANDTTSFEYIRHGLRDPLLIQFQRGEAFLNGQPLSPSELKQLMDTVGAGQAEIRRYGHSEGPIQKMESSLRNLTKMEPKLKAALGAAKGSLDEDTYRTLARSIFMDDMVEGGNKKAYAHMLENPPPGIHIAIDGNSFGQLNKIYSFETGDSAIRAMGKAIVDAKKEADTQFAPPKSTSSIDPAERDLEDLTQSKVWRNGGDEFRAHIPLHDKMHEHAASFARLLRNKLDALPPIKGTHKLSVSMGMGPTPELADQSQIQAKQAKKMSGKLPGMEDTHVHSFMPGHEGHVPVAEPAPIKPEPLPELPEIVKQPEVKAA